MNNLTAQAIQDRALTLSYERRQYPETAPMVDAWLRLAARWANSHGEAELALHVSIFAASPQSQTTF